MRFTVYQYNGSRNRFGEEALQEWPAAYEAVATVEAVALGHVFELTQHFDTPWTDSPEVTLSDAKARQLAEARKANPAVNSSVATQIRSTSVGDVYVGEDGYAHGVARMGFISLGYINLRVHDAIAEIRRQVQSGEISGQVAYDRITALQDLLSDHYRMVAQAAQARG